MHETNWGGWQLDESNLTLALFDDTRWVYEVDLDRCSTSAAVLDWIFQVRQKSWATPSIVAGLLNALNDLVYPQGRLCSFGKERGPKPFNLKEYKAEVKRKLDRKKRFARGEMISVAELLK